jgi:hypothetical protein
MFVKTVVNKGLIKLSQLNEQEMASFNYNPHNQFKAIVFLDRYVDNKELAESVKTKISKYYEEYRKKNPPKSKYST